MALIDENIRAFPNSGKTLGFLFAASVLDALFIVGQALGLGFALSNCWNGAGSDFSGVLEAQVGWIALFLGCFVGKQAMKYLRDKHMDSFSRKCAAGLRRELAEHLIAAGPNAVQAHGMGAVTAMMVEGIAKTQSYIALVLPKVADLMAIPAVLSIALFAIDWVSGIIAIVMLPCIILYMRMLGANTKDAAAKQHGEFQRTGNHFVDTLRGISTLKAFGRSKGHADEIFETSERFRLATLKTLRAAFLSSLVLDLFRTFALAAIAIMLGFRLMSGFIDLLPALAILIIVPEYFAAIRRYANDFHASLEGKNQLQSICDFLAEEVPETASASIGPWTGNSVLKLQDVGFSYENEGVGHAALRGLDLEVAGCVKVGIVGLSGSGKSTLVRLLAGFSVPDAGSFQVDGQRLAGLNCPSWRSQVTYIPQNPHLFQDTLRENIGFYCPNASDDRILEAACVAGLDVASEDFPQGLDTVVGQGGRALSGGQAQRVALARAFLDENRRILLFDEPTAHLDIETELAIKQRMLPLMEGKLVFFATHRLHWMANMDYILVLEDGGIVQAGTPAELEASCGAYSNLVSRLRGGEDHGE